ncbi:MAG: hypothetical protein KF870_14790 [Leadbetterella sp.]|nr:hypothetical protein [Leadbetterella sp.]
MIKKGTLLLLLTGLISSCQLFPGPEKNQFLLNLDNLASEKVIKLPVNGSAHAIRVSITGNISDSLAVQWGNYGKGDTLHVTERFVLPPGKVDYFYKGDFYGNSLYIKHTPFENSSIDGVLRVDMTVHASGN